MKKINKIAILEPGAWGTALGIILSKKHKVDFCYQNLKLYAEISKSRENKRLSGVKVPKNIFISPSFDLVEKGDLAIIASPSFRFRKTLFKLKKFKKLPPLLGLAKGFEKETLKLPSQVIEENFGKLPYAHLSGPGFAKEIVRKKPSQEVIASKNSLLLKKLKEIFKIKHLQVSTTNDLIGLQIAGAMKNSLAIGISLIERQNSNPQKRKKLIDFALNEMIKIGKAMGGKEKTFNGPAGLGDLILTSTNPLSRNFQFGQALFSNAHQMRKEIREGKITVEGFDSIWAAYQLEKKYHLKLPIINELYKIIYQKFSPKKSVQKLNQFFSLE